MRKRKLGRTELRVALRALGSKAIALAFGVEIDKDVVRRVLARHYRPGDSGTTCPSCLTFIAQAKDSRRRHCQVGGA